MIENKSANDNTHYSGYEGLFHIFHYYFDDLARRSIARDRIRIYSQARIKRRIAQLQENLLVAQKQSRRESDAMASPPHNIAMPAHHGPYIRRLNFMLAVQQAKQQQTAAPT